MNNKKSFLQSTGLFLHDKFEFHLLIELAFNLLAVIPVISLFELFKFSLVSYESIAGVIIFIVVFTLVVESFKVYILRYFIDFVFKTKGVLIYLLYFGIFYLTTFIIKDFSFNKNVLLRLFVFTTVFLIFKVLFIIIYQRYAYKKNEVKENEKLD